jgi:hypothetical protein
MYNQSTSPNTKLHLKMKLGNNWRKHPALPLQKAKTETPGLHSPLSLRVEGAIIKAISINL